MPDDSILPAVDSDITQSTPDTATTARLAAALFMASLGFRVFPIAPNSKQPLIAGVDWREIATTDETQIRKWFAEYPGVNYGVSPGESHAVIDVDVSLGIVVLKNGDIKKLKNGLKELHRLESMQPIEDWISGTFAVDTPRGGRHLYLRVVHPVSNAHGFPAGIDVRGARGYVVGPGSIVGGKLYRFVDKSALIIDAPAWVMARLKKPGEKDERKAEPVFEWDKPPNIKRARDYLAMRDPAVGGKGGNIWTYQTAAWIRQACVSEGACVELMQEEGGWNSRCDPPWDDGELRTVVRNAYRYAQNRPGGNADHMSEYLDSIGAAGNDPADHGASDDPAAGIPDETAAGRKDKEDGKARLRAMMIRGAESNRPMPDAPMIIPDWLPTEGLVSLVAQYSVGKTIALTDLANRIACMMKWHNGFPIDPEYRANYLCPEYPIGLRYHCRAWEKHYGQRPDDDRLLIMPSAPDLMNESDTALWAEFLREQNRDRPTVTLLDTWQRSTDSASQFDDMDMQTAVKHAEYLAAYLDGPVIAAFHPPKNTKKEDDLVILGTSVTTNRTTAIWRMVKLPNGDRKLWVHRLKLGVEGTSMFLKLKQISFAKADGTPELDSSGRELTGMVAICSDSGSGDHFARTAAEREDALNRSMAEDKGRKETALQSVTDYIAEVVNAELSKPTLNASGKRVKLTRNSISERLAALTGEECAARGIPKRDASDWRRGMQDGKPDAVSIGGEYYAVERPISKPAADGSKAYLKISGGEFVVVRGYAKTSS